MVNNEALLNKKAFVTMHPRSRNKWDDLFGQVSAGQVGGRARRHSSWTSQPSTTSTNAMIPVG